MSELLLQLGPAPSLWLALAGTLGLLAGTLGLTLRRLSMAEEGVRDGSKGRDAFARVVCEPVQKGGNWV